MPDTRVVLTRGWTTSPQLCPQLSALEGPRPPPTGVPAWQPGLGGRGHRGRRGRPPAAPRPCCLGPRRHEQGFTPRALAQFRCRWFSTRHFHSNPDLSEKQMRQQKEKTPASSSSLAQQAQGWASRGCADPDTPRPCCTRTEEQGGTQTPEGRLLTMPNACCELRRALWGLARNVAALVPHAEG